MTKYTRSCPTLMTNGSSWWPRHSAAASLRRRSTPSPRSTSGSSTASRASWTWSTSWRKVCPTAPPCGWPRSWALRIPSSLSWWAPRPRSSKSCGRNMTSIRPSRWWIPAPPSSTPRRLTIIPPTMGKMRPSWRTTARRRCWFWAPAPSGLARASSSTTAPSTPCGR